MLSTDVDQLLNATGQRQVMALIPILMPIDFPEVFNVENQYFGGTPQAFNPLFPSGKNPYENDTQLKDKNGNFLHLDILDKMVSI